MYYMFKNMLRPNKINEVFQLLALISWMPFFVSSQDHSCSCKPVTNCPKYSALLLNHAPHENDYVLNQIRDAGCGFRGWEPLVCCPTKRYRSSYIQPRAFSSEYDPYKSLESTTKEPWVWDAKQFPLNEDKRSIQYRDSDNVNFLDHIDAETPPNWPYTLYEGYGPYTKNVIDPASVYHTYKYGIENNNQHYNIPAWQNSLQTPETKRTTEILDAPIVYPDDKRLNRRIIFPMPPKRQTATTTTTTMLPPPSAETPPARFARINAPNCGISISTRIFGGVDSIPGQFPWIARIAYLNKTSNRISYRCSGTVITEFHILTAAHCVSNLAEDLELSHVRIGDLEIPRKCHKHQRYCRTSNKLLISDIKVHPNYNQPKLSNDIALLRIEMPQNMSFNYTICLPIDSSEEFLNRLVGSTGVVAGWSTSDDGTEIVNSAVKFLRLPIVNISECAVTYAKYSENFKTPIKIESTQLCAQGQPQNDVCRGDSGGPFMDDGTSGLINSDGRYSLLGIVAFGPTTCGLLNFPGVYTRVSAYIGWIVNCIR